MVDTAELAAARQALWQAVEDWRYLSGGTTEYRAWMVAMDAFEAAVRRDEQNRRD